MKGMLLAAVLGLSGLGTQAWGDGTAVAWQNAPPAVAPVTVPHQVTSAPVTIKVPVDLSHAFAHVGQPWAMNGMWPGSAGISNPVALNLIPTDITVRTGLIPTDIRHQNLLISK